MHKVILVTAADSSRSSNLLGLFTSEKINSLTYHGSLLLLFNIYSPSLQFKTRANILVCRHWPCVCCSRSFAK